MSAPHFRFTGGNFTGANYSGTDYTGTIGFLAAGLLFVPAVLAISQPANTFALYLALTCSLICLVLARLTWTQASRVTMPSIGVDKDIRLISSRLLYGEASLVTIPSPNQDSVTGRRQRR